MLDREGRPSKFNIILWTTRSGQNYEDNRVDAEKAKPKTVVIKKKVEASVGLWTEKEHRKFVDALIIHGKDWKAL